MSTIQGSGATVCRMIGEKSYTLRMGIWKVDLGATSTGFGDVTGLDLICSNKDG